MATRVVEGKKPYTGGKAISIDENKVISLNLRDENNLIIYDEGDDEIYVDLQLDDEITPTSAFPIGVNTGRVIVDNGWDKTGTIICAKTTSGDNIKLFYADEGTLWIDNGTGTFKQIYFKADVDALLLALRNYIDGELAKKQNGVSSDTAPEDPVQGDLWYDTINDVLKVYDGSQWNSTGGGSDIEYVTQAEYNALPSSKLTDNKHYFIYISSGGGVLFDFGDWTDSVWTTGPRSSATQGTITKTATYISFYNSSSYSTNYLSQYPIDGTRDFLLEFNGNMPNTSVSDHQIGLVDAESGNNMLGFYTYYDSNGTIYCYVDGTRYNSASNPGTADYFIRKEGTVLTMGWGGNTIYTNSNFSSTSTYYLYEKVYRDTITINTAKLTYL